MKMRKHIGFLLFLPLVLILVGASETIAEEEDILSEIIDGTKKFTFDVTNANGDGAIGGNETGSYYYMLQSFAHDEAYKDNERNSIHDYLPYPNTSGTPARKSGLMKPAQYVDDSNTVGKRAIANFSLWSTPYVDFNQVKQGSIRKTAEVERYRSFADIDVSLGHSPVYENDGKWTVEAEFEMESKANVKRGGDGLRIAQSYASAKMGFTGHGKVDEDGKSTKKKIGKYFTAKLYSLATRKGTTKAGGKTKGNINDPISLTVIDEITEEILGQEDLYQEIWSTEHTASISWFDEQEPDEFQGLKISVLGNFDPDPIYHTNSAASIMIETLSDWVLNPINGMISLDANGVFVTTGDFNDLTWDISAADGYHQAVLPLSELRPELSFDVEPYGLPANRDVLLKAYSPLEGYMEAMIPEPVSIALLALGGLVVLRRRR